MHFRVCTGEENDLGVRVIVTIEETSPFNYKVSCSVEDTDSSPVPYLALNWQFQKSYQFPSWYPLYLHPPRVTGGHLS